jgi:hypothetical protein
LRFSVAGMIIRIGPTKFGMKRLTFKMEEDIGLVVLEHLGDQLDVHILNVDLLDAIVSNGQENIVVLSPYL